MTYDPDLEVGSKLERVLFSIGRERRRQDVLKAQGRFEHTAADDIPLAEKYAMLGEEFGEIAREVLTQPGDAIAHDTKGSREGLRKELTQLAAISTAWLETL